MNNPYGALPQYALYPLPATSAGGRLYAMLAEATGLSMRDYLDAFERVNLCAGGWSLREARVRAAELVPALADRSVVLLGREVQRAFRLDLEPLSVATVGSVVFYALPHPSGLCRWYNEAGNRARVGSLLARLQCEYAGVAP